jgi:hypothetical protein
MMTRIALALLATALATPALAADSADQHYSKPKKPHLICKRDQDTATRMSRAVCKTAEQWADGSRDDDEAHLGTINREATTHDTGATLSRDRPR